MGDFPTRVGMARRRTHKALELKRFPHPRGDGPTEPRTSNLDRLISPPAWGWPVSAENTADIFQDFPTRVGMARSEIISATKRNRFPHPRGDGPS